MNVFKIKCHLGGAVKVAIYSDASGQPGDLLAAVDTETPVVSGWNSVNIAATPVTAGTYYWLAFNSSSGIVCMTTTPGSGAYISKYVSYSGFTFPASAGSGFTNYAGYTIPMAGYGDVQLSVTTASLPDGAIGVAYSQTLQANGGSGSYTWSITSGSLPAGLPPISSGGLISGTPTTAATYNFTAQVNDGSITATKDLSITINTSSPQRLVGTDTSSTGTFAAGYIGLSKFIATGTGTVSQIKVYGTAAGNVKAAIYSDSGGQPGTLLNANNNNNAVLASQWNSIPITGTSVTSGTAYWLGTILDTDNAVAKVTSANPYRYKAQPYAGFSWPGSLTGLSTSDTIYLCIAGWSTVP
jgi:hypothetical protein